MTSKASVRRKIGHWRLTKDGIITYKRRPASELVQMIQIGMRHSISRAGKLEREPLMHDFESVETGHFPAKGSAITPPHSLADFRFVTYAPLAFRYFRALYGIENEDFIQSLCDEPLSEIANPGASGSLFFLSHDNCFIIKTVQKREASFLQKLLPVYYVNLSESRNTLLPKFYGLYNCHSGRKNIRLLVMNNLLPPYVSVKFDLKGSTYKRVASHVEKRKSSPTLKDLDFLNTYAGKIILDDEKLRALEETVERDTKILRSLAIMDYSLLVGIYAPAQANSENGQPGQLAHGNIYQNRQYAEGMVAQTVSGEKLYLFLGIIDILQSYRLVKRMEHYLKALVHDGDTISVHRPDFYALRFKHFIFDSVFLESENSMHRGGLRRSASAGDLGSTHGKKFLKPPIVNVIPPTINTNQGRKIANFIAFSVSHHNLADPLDLAWTHRRLTLKRQKATTMDDNYLEAALRCSTAIAVGGHLSPPSRRNSLHNTLNRSDPNIVASTKAERTWSRVHKSKTNGDFQDQSSVSSVTSESDAEDTAVSSMPSKNSLAPPSRRFSQDIEDVVIDNEDKFSRPKKNKAAKRPETWL